MRITFASIKATAIVAYDGAKDGVARAYHATKDAAAGLLVAAGVGVGLLTAAPAAHAAEPTYTSQIGSALSAVNMTDLTADVSSFSGMGFTLLLTTTGVLFVAVLLRKFLK